jgi:hypothetical protein
MNQLSQDAHFFQGMKIPRLDTFLVVKTRAGFDPWAHIHGDPLVICYIAMENHHF